MGKVTITGYLQVPEEELAEVAAALPKHRDLSRAETGCLVFEDSQDEADPCKFNLYEQYTSAEAFDYHKQRAAGSEWGSISVNLQRHLTIEESDS